MFRVLIGLFTLITSFFGLWGSTSPLLANVGCSQDLESLVVNSPDMSLSLNYCGSLTQLDGQDSKSIFEHLGCSCVDCLQKTKKYEQTQVILQK